MCTRADMEDRVKCILFLLGEEADSFAKRAEMYYKRRPEVICSVEEAYRAYRALAERYDHMSGELHKANHTIATAFPDQIQYSLLEEDNDNLPKAFTAVERRKIHKSTVEELMKKKHGEKSRPKGSGEKSAAPVSKDNAQAEISRLQKEILVLQTEKEFVKSSYESRIAKYWDLEKKINEMQEEVCYFQDEFNESAEIEDHEAQALMAATALKSCEGAITKMQEQQKSVFRQEMIESERVEVSRHKLKSFFRAYGKSLAYSANSADENVNNDASARKDELFSMKQEKTELQELVGKIRGYFEMRSDLSVEDIADKIDELVNKVVDLELMIPTQTAQINRLCLENNELEKSLQKLEEEKAEQTCGSGELDGKLKEAEEVLIRVHNLLTSYHAEERIVYTNFEETINSFCDISHMLLQSPLTEQQAVSRCMLNDEATESTDTELSSVHGKTNPSETPEMDETARKPHVDGFTNGPDTSEPSIFSDDRQSSSCHYEIKAERHSHVDKTEDLWCCEFEDKFSISASVDVGTTENADHNLSADNNNGGAEHVDEVTRNNESSVQPYIAHSLESCPLEQLHRNSPSSPGENVKQEDNVICYSTQCNNMSESRPEQNMEMDEAEASYVNKNPSSTCGEVANVGDQEDDVINLQQSLMAGIQEKEKVLLDEYTSILRNYKNAKRRLAEVETKNQECLNEMRAMISELERANEMKDAEIRSLCELFKSLTYKDASKRGHQLNSTMSLSEKNKTVRGHRRTPSILQLHQRAQSVSSIPRRMENNSSLKNILNTSSSMEPDVPHDAVTNQENIILEDLTPTNVVEMEKASPLEEKFRRNIDALMEENLALLMKLSMSFQQIQGFQTKYDQLQSEISKVTNDKLKPNKDGTNECPADSEMEATKKRLRELKIELQVWSEQNMMFKGELQCRFDSLCNLQEEIEGAKEMDEDTEHGARFTWYQVAKFQGEVLNMKQENNKVADEVQASLDHVEGLHTELDKVLAKIVKSTSLSGPKASSTWRNAPSKSKVPLRMFLFPAKKKKTSLFACVNPSYLSKQHSDMAFFTKMS